MSSAKDTSRVDSDFHIKMNDANKQNHENRIIVSFPDGDVENPYNWPTVCTFATPQL